MDAAARIEAVKKRLETQYADLIKARDAGPPCKKCRYFVSKVPSPPAEIAPAAEAQWFELLHKGHLCRHPAYVRHTYNPVRGELRDSAHVSAAEARQEDGLCGPEALLFEPYPLWRLMLGYAR